MGRRASNPAADTDRRCRYCGKAIAPDAYHPRCCVTCMTAGANRHRLMRSRCEPPRFLCHRGHPRKSGSGERCATCDRIDTWRARERQRREVERHRRGELTDLEIERAIDAGDRHAWNFT